MAVSSPLATYRFQLHKGFTFFQAAEVVPHLARLGISHAYASPIETALPGSTHGYDIADHGALNPELGGEEGFRVFSTALTAAGLKLIVDIVPNHMGIAGAGNSSWLSTLEWGPDSPAAGVFDIDWRRGPGGRLVAPFLGRPYGEALESGAIVATFHPHDGAFSVMIGANRFPLNPLSYPVVLEPVAAALPPQSAKPILAIAETLRDHDMSPRRPGTFAVGESAKQSLARLVGERPEIAAAVASSLATLNGIEGDRDSFGALHRLLERQHYRLAFWRVASSDINYRRFFDIDTLAGVRAEDPAVFDATHALILRLVADGSIHGLRIDHIDGLADPAAYLARLRAIVGPEVPLFVEKILEPGEALRPWPIQGTTGYEALNLVDGLFVATGAEAAFDSIHAEVVGRPMSFQALLRQCKRRIVEGSFATEVESIVADLKTIAELDRATRDHSRAALQGALTDLLVAFPVYRTYLDNGPAAPEDLALLDHALEDAKAHTTLLDPAPHAFIVDVLLGRVPPIADDTLVISRLRRHVQQLTGPVMAKSLEDTAFYRYARFVALNEVGGDPSLFGVAPAAFHEITRTRAAAFPNAMLASATHDTKRGEDMRARLFALTHDPEGFRSAVGKWTAVIAEALDPEAPAPADNDLYFLFQTMLGAWPIGLLDGDDPGICESFADRLSAYAVKAMREAKTVSSWTNPNQPLEEATAGLLHRLTAPGSAFLSEFRPLANRLARSGALNSLARTILKCTLPGFPDFFQGTERWDLSLVDPDNRRPVDYAVRSAAMSDETTDADLFQSWRDGAIKQRLTSRLLAARAAHRELFTHGTFSPMDMPAGWIGFQRRLEEETAIVAVMTAPAGARTDGLELLTEASAFQLDSGRWRSTTTGTTLHHPGGSWTADLGAYPGVVLIRQALLA